MQNVSEYIGLLAKVLLMVFLTNFYVSVVLKFFCVPVLSIIRLLLTLLRSTCPRLSASSY